MIRELAVAAVVWPAAATAPAEGFRQPPPAVRRAVQVWPKAQRGTALAVAWCESRFETWARNGQYWGIWQLGKHERAKYGYGPTALAQARGAVRLWRARGWEPWSCRP
jgi:hypothetical protein